jgi:hypothetical protein
LASAQLMSTRDLTLARLQVCDPHADELIMQLARYWPGYVLGLLAVAGGIAGGLGVAVGAPIVGVLGVGPAYLIQQRVRRRRGAPPPGGLLGRDANEVLTSLTIAELRLIQRHPVGAYALTIAFTTGAFVFFWRMSSLTVAIALVGPCLGLGVAVAILVAVRRK